VLTTLRFLADLNISPLTIEALRQESWDIVRSSHWLPANASDEEILSLARRENRVVVTHDLDFSALVALSGMGLPSLITLRLSTSEPEIVTQKLLETAPLLTEMLREGCAVTIEDGAVRVRKLPI
jgi:predicted nuclease of predicted toxin-antitoxin system